MRDTPCLVHAPSGTWFDPAVVVSVEALEGYPVDSVETDAVVVTLVHGEVVYYSTPLPGDCENGEETDDYFEKWWSKLQDLRDALGKWIADGAEGAPPTAGQ